MCPQNIKTLRAWLFLPHFLSKKKEIRSISANANTHTEHKELCVASICAGESDRVRAKLMSYGYFC